MYYKTTNIEYLGELLYSQLASGIYFLHIIEENSLDLKQKFTILK